MERIKRNKKRNYTIYTVIAVIALTVGYATYVQPLAHKLATIVFDNSRFGIWNNKTPDKNQNNPNNNSNTNNNNGNNTNTNNSSTPTKPNNNRNNDGGISTKQWDISFIDAKKIETNGIVNEIYPVSYNKLSGAFNVMFRNQGDSITYEFTVKNKGELDAKLDSYDIITNDNNDFKFHVEGLNEGEELQVNKTKTMTIKTTYVGESPDNLSPDNINTDIGKIAITLRYIQK